MRGVSRFFYFEGGDYNVKLYLNNKNEGVFE